MEKRKLEKGNLEVSATGLGCMSMLSQRSSWKGQDAPPFPAKLVGR
jgi:aryl-alcohol dehydrogenase-like predicted oxidoreductase